MTKSTFGRHPYFLTGKAEQQGRDVPLPRATAKGGDKPASQVLRSTRQFA